MALDLDISNRARDAGLHQRRPAHAGASRTGRWRRPPGSSPSLIGAGLALVDALRLLAGQAEERRLRDGFDAIARDVERGGTLAAAFATRRDVFPPLCGQPGRAGEVGGVLESVLHRLAAHLEQSARLRRTVLGALAYPAVVVTAAVAVTAVLLGWVVPVFASAFASAGAELPVPTAVVLALSLPLCDRTSSARRRGRDGVGRHRCSPRCCERPVASQLRDRLAAASCRASVTLLAKAAVARATRTLGTLLACGVAILDALDIAARTAGNRVVADALTLRARSSRAARSLATLAGGAPGDSRDGPPDDRRRREHRHARRHARPGGGLPTTTRCRRPRRRLLALLEPALILFLGVVVGGLVVSMYLPIFRLGAVLG